MSHVRLVRSSTIPGRKGRVLKVQMEGVLPMCAEDCSPPLLFEPRRDELGWLGLGCQESLVLRGVLVPVENWEGVCVSLEEGFDLGMVRYLDPVTSDVRECLGPAVSAVRESCVAGVVVERSNADEPVECEPSAERVNNSLRHWSCH